VTSERTPSKIFAMRDQATIAGPRSEKTQETGALRAARGLAMPAEHGAWGILIAPYVCAAAIGEVWNVPLLLAGVCALSLFLLRGSMDAQGGLRSILLPAHLALAILAVVTGGSLLLVYRREQLIALALLAGALYALQLVLVRSHNQNREEKRSLAAEFAGVALLTLGALLAWIAGRGILDERGVQVWLLNLGFFLGGVLYVKYRVRGILAHQKFTGVKDRLAFAWPVFSYQVALLLALAFVAERGWLAGAVVVAFVPGFLRAWSLLSQLGQRFPIRRVGWNEILHSAVFTALLILAFRFSR
jgi:YwiC-like protein